MFYVNIILHNNICTFTIHYKDYNHLSYIDMKSVTLSINVYNAMNLLSLVCYEPLVF